MEEETIRSENFPREWEMMGKIFSILVFAYAFRVLRTQLKTLLKVRHLTRLIRIKLASFTFQLIHIVTGDIVRRTWSSIEGFRTMNARRLNRRTQVRQAAQ